MARFTSKVRSIVFNFNFSSSQLSRSSLAEFVSKHICIELDLLVKWAKDYLKNEGGPARGGAAWTPIGSAKYWEIGQSGPEGKIDHAPVVHLYRCYVTSGYVI